MFSDYFSFTCLHLLIISSGLLSPPGIKRAHAPASPSATPLAAPLATFTDTQPLSLLSSQDSKLSYRHVTRHDTLCTRVRHCRCTVFVSTWAHDCLHAHAQMHVHVHTQHTHTLSMCISQPAPPSPPLPAHPSQPTPPSPPLHPAPPNCACVAARFARLTLALLAFARLACCSRLLASLANSDRPRSPVLGRFACFALLASLS